MSAPEAISSTRTMEEPMRAPRLHHIAIQTSNLENAKAWYEDFFGCRASWSLSTFNDVTLSRLPGIRCLIEMVVGETRLHLFERSTQSPGLVGTNITQFQHVGFSVESFAELLRLRKLWLELFASGRYQFAVDSLPTEIVTDADGSQNFYALDVNGLEFEFVYQPS